MLVRIGIAANIQGELPSTLRRWEKEEKILPCGRTRGGHRRYKLSQMLGEEKEEKAQHKQVVPGYARVSGAKQKKELVTQPFAVICTYEDRIARFGTKVINRFC